MHHSYSLFEWAKKIPSGYPELRKGALESRIDLPYTLSALGLPCYRSVNTTLESFLSAPDEYIDAISCDTYWLQFIPTDDLGSRTSFHNIKQSDVTNFINDNKPQNVGSYMLHLSEFENSNYYGGNIVVSGDGNIIAEFSSGLQTKVASQSFTPEFFASTRLGTNTIDYTFDDKTLRTCIWEAIKPVRKMPGYFEFTVLDGMRPIFLDARLFNPIYQRPNKLEY